MPFVHSDKVDVNKYWRIGTSRVNKFKGMKKGSALNRSLDIFVTLHNHPANLKQIRYEYTNADGNINFGNADANYLVDKIIKVELQRRGGDAERTFNLLAKNIDIANRKPTLEEFKEDREDEVDPKTLKQLINIRETNMGTTNSGELYKKAKKIIKKAAKSVSSAINEVPKQPKQPKPIADIEEKKIKDNKRKRESSRPKRKPKRTKT